MAAKGVGRKPPKTRHGFRTISLPKSTGEVLREHYLTQVEQRLLSGLGRMATDDYVLPLADGSPYPPDELSRDWANLVRDRKLPRIMFHALRHSHASALIAAGMDIVTVSRQLVTARPRSPWGSMHICSIKPMRWPRARSKRRLGPNWVQQLGQPGVRRRILVRSRLPIPS